MKTVAIFTTTRAEFGLLKPFIKQLQKSSSFNYKLFVGGTHLKKKLGYSIKEIKNNNVYITETIDYLEDDISYEGAIISLAKFTFALSGIFKNHSFDFVCVLGDRYELIPIVQTAIVFKKPIIHIHGGEETHGAIDEQVRHMITKAAHVHFASCEEYRNNILRMGEESWRVHNTGALAVENMKNTRFHSKKHLFELYGLDIQTPLGILTYHPETISNLSVVDQIKIIFNALDELNIQIIITGPNVDIGGDVLIKEIYKHVDDKKYFFRESLGNENYLNLVNVADLVIGNSSSGIIEVPFFKVPTVNIGVRQKGRLRHQSIIDTNHSIEQIKNGVMKAMDDSYCNSLESMEYKFGNGEASKRMVKILELIWNRDDMMIKKLNFDAIK